MQVWIRQGQELPGWCEADRRTLDRHRQGLTQRLFRFHRRRYADTGATTAGTCRLTPPVPAGRHKTTVHSIAHVETEQPLCLPHMQWFGWLSSGAG